jgi:hypothetical protein
MIILIGLDPERSKTKNKGQDTENVARKEKRKNSRMGKDERSKGMWDLRFSQQ